MTFTAGGLVAHPKRPEWGPGKILRLDGDQALVFFVDAGSHNGALKNPLAVVTSFLAPSPLTSHPRLDHLAPLEGDSVTAGGQYVTLEEGKRLFLKRFPAGLRDARFVQDERTYKLEAHEECRHLLARDPVDECLAARDYEEIARRALHVVGMVNLPTQWDHMALGDGLKAPLDQERFAMALRPLLHGDAPQEARFTAFANVLEGLPRKQAPVLSWPNQTILLFLWDPRHQMFMKPMVTKEAAARCAFDLRYRAEPNWATYRQVLRLTEILFDELSELEPRDNIDVQSFIWVIGGHPERPGPT